MASIQTIKADPTRNRKKTIFRVQWRDPDGKQRSRSFTNITAARSHRSKVEADIARGTYRDPDKAKVTFEEFARAWLRSAPGGAAYRASRLSILENHLLPPLGKTPMRDITARRLREVVAGLRLRSKKNQGKPAARSTAESVAHLLSAIMHAAVEEGIYAKAPLPTKWPLPEGRPTERAFLTRDEADTLLAVVPEYWKPLVMFLMDTGCRWGEAVALRSSNLALDFSQVVIAESLSEVKGHFETKTTKNRRRRAIYLPERTVQALREHLRLHPPAGEGFVFTTPSGAHIQRSRWRRTVWDPAVKNSGINKKVTPHGLRHSHISQMIAAGVDPVRVARRAGHSKPSVTVNMYAHVFADGDQTAVETWEAFWRRPTAAVADLGAVATE